MSSPLSAARRAVRFVPLLALAAVSVRTAGAQSFSTTTREYAGAGCAQGVVGYEALARPGGGVSYIPSLGDVACLNVRAFTTRVDLPASEGGGIEWFTRLTWTGWINEALRYADFGGPVLESRATGLISAPAYIGIQVLPGSTMSWTCSLAECDYTFEQTSPLGDGADERIPTAAIVNAFYRLENSGPLADNIALNVPLHAVPEPSTWLLMGTGLLAVGGVAARRTRQG